MKKKMIKYLGFVLEALFLLLILFPFYWQIVTSLKNPADISLMPTQLWPHRFSTAFYKSVFVNHNFGRYLTNSFVVGTVTMAVGVITSIPAAYAFARLNFSLKKFWKTFILIANMFPIIALVTPLFVLFKKMHLINTYTGMIVPSIMITLPLAIWTLSAFLEKIPKELEQAAQVDGASRFHAVLRITLPLMAPGIFSTAIIVFVTAWNELMFSLVLVTKDEMRTVPVGISLFSGQFTVPWGDISAASVVATIPILALVLIFQKRIVAGLTSGAVKG